MSGTKTTNGWNIEPPCIIEPSKRLEHVRHCSAFAAGLLDRFPDWLNGLDDGGPPDPSKLRDAIRQHGLKPGLRRFRNRAMLGIVWRDLCGLASLSRTFSDLGALGETCLEAAIDEEYRSLEERYGVPRAADGEPQRLFVIGLGKFGGGELNLSSDIDIMFCYPRSGESDGSRSLSNDPFFTRLARAVISDLSEITEDGFCFRVDTRLRPFGNAGPLVSNLAAMEQYYQREGRDWERYALVKARPVAGDTAAGERFLRDVQPFVYRRYIDYSAVESLQEMHANVLDDARRKDRLDDIKRGPGGIREIEFLAQCFQILRGGREPSLQTPSLCVALEAIERLGLLEPKTVEGLRDDYAFLRFLENRVQAMHDRQTHTVPPGEERERIAHSMGLADAAALDLRLAGVRERVSGRFHGIFPAREVRETPDPGTELWREYRREGPGEASDPLALFVRRLERIALSQRADQRLERFMPALLAGLDQKNLDETARNRVFDLVLAICRRSAYLVLLFQHEKALSRMLDLFSASERIADQVTRFPALLDELIDPALGAHIPDAAELDASVERILGAGQDTESVLNALNYLKLATELRVAVGQLQKGVDACAAQSALADLACAILRGVLAVAGREIENRHGRFLTAEKTRTGDAMAVIGYGTLGAQELSYGSDLDIVFLFEKCAGTSDGARPLAPEQYFARWAQRMLSFLTVMTPSGRLYEVDTRLRPNGRAGSLVSNLEAFREYQEKEAWTWEWQALTRARFIAGSPSLRTGFERVRRDVLCRRRDEDELAADMLEMRRKISANLDSGLKTDAESDEKHGSGGLIDIEFIAQLGILVSAHDHPDVVDATSTTEHLLELSQVGWLSERESKTLLEVMGRLRERRMMTTLVNRRSDPEAGMAASAEIFERKFTKHA